MPNVYSQLSIQHFGDGLNTDHPTSIPDHALAKAENIQYTQEKKVAPKPGMSKRFGSDFDSNPVIGIAPYYKADGTTRLIMAAGTSLYVDTPHVIFNYDTQTDWDGGIHNLDSSAVPGDIKLLAAPTSSFVRSTVAYNNDGTQVAANTPRYKAAKYSNGAWAEKGTTNLLTANQASVETDTTGFVSSGATISRDTTKAWHGASSLKAVTAGAVVTEWAGANFAGAISTTYTISVWVWAPQGASMELNATDNIDLFLGNTKFTGTGAWQRVTLKVTTDALHGSFLFYVATADTPQAITFWLDGLQIEQKAYATSWTDGGSTRSADNLSHTLPKPLPVRNAGCTWYKPDHASSLDSALAWIMNTTTTPVWRYLVSHDGTYFHFKKNDGTTVYDAVSAAVSFAAGDIIFVSWLDDPTAGYMKLWYGINGAALTEVSLANTVQITDAQKVYWGSRDAAGYECDGVIDDPQLYHVGTVIANGGAVDVSFWNAIYTSAVAQVWSMNTLFHSSLDSVLDVDTDRQGVWVSPTQNGSTSTDTSTFSVAWTADVLVNTALSAQVATSADGVTWSAWYDQVNGSTATAPANAYSKVRFIFQEVSNAGTATLHVATASYDGTPSAALLLSGLSVSANYSFAQLQNTLVACNGVDIPKQYDGTAITDLAAAPRASTVCTYKNRMFMAKDANNKSRVYFSALANIQDWTTANDAGLIDVNPNDGDEIMALVPMDTTLLVVKGHASYYLQGYSPQTFQVTPAGNGGTLSPWGAIWTQYGVFRLDREGVWATNFATQVLLTKEKGVQKIWDGLNQRQLGKAALFVWQDKLLVAVPNGTSSYNNLVLVYDLSSKAWSTWTGWVPSCFTSYWERGLWLYLFGSGTVGNVFQIGGANDAGTAFTSTIETKHFAFTGLDHAKRVKWADLSFAGGTVDTTIGLTAITDGVESAEKTVVIPANQDNYPVRLSTPAYARTMGFKARWLNTSSSGATFLGMDVSFFPKASRPTRVV